MTVRCCEYVDSYIQVIYSIHENNEREFHGFTYKSKILVIRRYTKRLKRMTKRQLSYFSAFVKTVFENDNFSENFGRNFNSQSIKDA